jgi:hypothetical protein
MPFVLYGLRRFFAARDRLPLIGGVLAQIAQNLSNGYFLLFFSPVVAGYALFEIARRRMWRDAWIWTSLIAAGIVVILATVPFLLPYLELRRLGFPPRSLQEIGTYSADALSYWTAPPESHVWGRTMRAFPKSGGDLFPTLTALLLAACGVAVTVRAAWRKSVSSTPAARGRQPVVYILLGICAIYAVLIGLVFSGFRFERLGPLPISVRGIGRPSLMLALCAGGVAALWPRARAFTRVCRQSCRVQRLSS